MALLELPLGEMAISAARVFEIARAAAEKREPADAAYLGEQWEAAVAAICGIGEGEVTVADAGERMDCAFHVALGLPPEARPAGPVFRLAWQAAASHVYVLLDLDDEDDTDLTRLEFGWADWVKERMEVR